MAEHQLRPKMIHENRNIATTPKVNFGQVIFQLPSTIRRIVRRIESLSKKIINAEAVISFNKICLSEDILPNYTNIYIWYPFWGFFYVQIPTGCPGRATGATSTTCQLKPSSRIHMATFI
jgi:hypothetical protein